MDRTTKPLSWRQMKRRYASMDIPTLLHWFRFAAEEQSSFRQTPHPQKGNPAAQATSDIFAELEARGGGAVDGLLPLLDHPEVGARLCAAAFALEFAPTVAEPIVEAITHGDDGMATLDAGMVLDVWRRRSLPRDHDPLDEPLL